MKNPFPQLEDHPLQLAEYFDRHGFDDGHQVPAWAQAIRQLFAIAVNQKARALNSNARVYLYDSTIHNPLRLIVAAPQQDDPDLPQFTNQLINEVTPDEAFNDALENALTLNYQHRLTVTANPNALGFNGITWKQEIEDGEFHSQPGTPLTPDQLKPAPSFPPPYTMLGGKATANLPIQAQSSGFQPPYIILDDKARHELLDRIPQEAKLHVAMDAIKAQAQILTDYADQQLIAALAIQLYGEQAKTVHLLTELINYGEDGSRLRITAIEARDEQGHILPEPATAHDIYQEYSLNDINPNLPDINLTQINHAQPPTIALAVLQNVMSQL